MNIAKSTCRELLGSSNVADLRMARRELGTLPDSSFKFDYLDRLDKYINSCAVSSSAMVEPPSRDKFSLKTVKVLCGIAIFLFIWAFGLVMHDIIEDRFVHFVGSTLGEVGILVGSGISCLMTAEVLNRYFDAQYFRTHMLYATMTSLTNTLRSGSDSDPESITSQYNWLIENLEKLFSTLP